MRIDLRARQTIVCLGALLAFATAMTGSAFAVPTVSVNSSKVLVVAGGSEDDSIDVSSSAGSLIVRNTNLGGTLVSGGGPCLLTNTDEVTCLYSGLVAPSISVSLNAGVDSASIDSSVPQTITATISGVSYAESSGAPLDARVDDDSKWVAVDGGPNPDRIRIDSPGACEVQVDGGGGDDEIYIDAESPDPDLESGCASISNVSGGAGDDLIDGSESAINLEYLASEGHDVFVGGSGDDHITVGNGPDWAFGGPGNDRFYDNGGGDPSKVWGGPGNDVYTDWDTSEADVTFYDGGSGTDNVAYHNYSGASPVTLSLDGVANDGVTGEYDNIRASVEQIGDPNIYGSGGEFHGDDTLSGSNGPNTIGGYDGDDSIDGLAGQDKLYGGNGNDTITGGTGLDLIYGEDGNDEIFAADGEVDTISCGGGSDTVHADAGDTVSGDCETVL